MATTHVYFYHAQALRDDGRVDMFSGIYRTSKAITNEEDFKACRQNISRMVTKPEHKALVIMSLSHIAAEESFGNR